MVSISEWTNHRISRLRYAVATPTPEKRLASASRVAAALAATSGFVAVAWIVRAPADKRLFTLTVAVVFFVLAVAYLAFSKRWRALPNTFGVTASLLIAVGIWADSRSWSIGLIGYGLASMYAAYFDSPRGRALQLTIASGSLLAALVLAGARARIVEWIAVTAALTLFALAVFLARNAADRLAEDLQARARGQEIVARLGQRALVETDIHALMQEAAEAAGEAPALERVGVFV